MPKPSSRTLPVLSVKDVKDATALLRASDLPLINPGLDALEQLLLSIAVPRSERPAS